MSAKAPTLTTAIIALALSFSCGDATAPSEQDVVEFVVSPTNVVISPTGFGQMELVLKNVSDSRILLDWCNLTLQAAGPFGTWTDMQPRAGRCVPQEIAARSGRSGPWFLSGTTPSGRYRFAWPYFRFSDNTAAPTNPPFTDAYSNTFEVSR